MPFPIIAAIAAGAGLAGAAGGAVAGVGKNKFQPKTFDQTGAYDKNRYEYGGAPGGANAAANNYAGQAYRAQFREGPQLGYTEANADRQLGLLARNYQQGAADLMMSRAQGLTPSIAQMQADRQMQQAAAQQASMAASARGAGGLALAQQNAAGNTATMQSAISNQAQINAAQERMAAEQAAFSAYGGLRGGDLASQQQAAQQAQYAGDLAMRQRGLNDAMTLGMTGYEQNVRQSQLNAGLQQQQILANSLTGQQTTSANIAQNNANREMEFLKMAMGAVGGGADAATAANAPKRALGGPVTAGQPYLVGEYGPELVVPASDGNVIPASQTIGLLGGVGGASSGPAAASVDRLDARGGLSPIASLRAHSNVATRYGSQNGGLY